MLNEGGVASLEDGCLVFGPFLFHLASSAVGLDHNLLSLYTQHSVVATSHLMAFSDLYGHFPTIPPVLAFQGLQSKLPPTPSPLQSCWFRSILSLAPCRHGAHPQIYFFSERGKKKKKMNMLSCQFVPISFLYHNLVPYYTPTAQKHSLL